jgi:NAD(P)-dependent dehydrogenase (short-subunit alcohol dehydrogenase family)
MAIVWDFSGQHAVVTGGSSGLGRQIATRLAEAGAAITVVDLAAALERNPLPSAWRSQGLDLSASDALQAMQALGNSLERLDIVIANAGVVPPWRRTAALDAAEWQRVMAVNTWGVAATLGGLAGALARSGGGSAVVMASINGYKAHPQQMLYTASKHAAIGIMRAAALDMGPQGTRVNALAPGAIATEALLERINTRATQGGLSAEEALSGLAAETALGQMATADQVASAALWLASPASAGITGIVVPVEAGLR